MADVAVAPGGASFLRAGDAAWTQLTIRPFGGPVRRIVLAFSLAAAPVAVPAIGIAQQPEWRSADHVAAIPRAELDSITARGRLEYIVTRSYYFRVDVNGHIAAYDRDTTRH